MSLNFLERLRLRESDKPLGGRYKLISQLSAGGFGHTFLAEDIHLPNHPRCVLKQLKPQFKDAGQLKIARRLFDTEAEVLYQLGSHDRIPRLLAHFEEQNEFYLAQELIVGQSLDRLLVEGKRWTQPAVVALLKDVLEVLAFVHQQGVIHRDIKPSNLIRRQLDSRIVLIDFGAVKQVSAGTFNTSTGQTSLTIAIGTQGYMPSEQLAGNPRFSSDIYAVGMVGIQALTGINPRYLKEDPQTSELLWQSKGASGQPEVNSDICPELAAVLTRMVRYDFRQRYSTAIEALEALQNLPAELLNHPSLARVEAEMVAAPAITLPEPAEPSVPPGVTLLSPLRPPAFAAQTDALNQADRETIVSSEDVLRSRLPSHLSEASVETRQGNAAEGAIAPSLQALTTLLARGTALLTPIAQRSRTKPWRLVGGVAAIVVLGLLVKALQPSQPPAPLKATAPPSNASPQSNASPAPNASPRSNASPPSASPAPQNSAAAPHSSVPQNPTAAPTAAAPDVDKLVQQARQLQDAKQYPGALALYKQAAAVDPKRADIHWGRCYSLNRLQQYTAALGACDKALALNPGYPEALWSKGYALDQQRRYAEALGFYERAIALKPDFAEAWSNKGTVLLRLDRPAEAIPAFDRAVKLNPRLAEAWNNRGAALWSLRQFDQAVASIDQALQIQPDYRDAKSLREQMRQQLGR